MKRIILLSLLVLAILAPGISKAQTIPNGDFEDWTTTSTPKNWVVQSGNALRITGVNYTITDPAGNKRSVFRPVYDGQYGIQLSSTISGTSAKLGLITNTFALTSRPAWLAMNIGYFGLQGESPLFAVLMLKYDTVAKTKDTVLWTGLLGGLQTFEPWVLATLDLSNYYKDANLPDSATIVVLNTGAPGGNTSAGTTLFMEKMWFAANKPAGIELTSPTANAVGISAYPNPFNSSTTIHYSLLDKGNVNLSVFDMQGRQVANLVNETQVSGPHDVTFNADNLKSGVYFYRFLSGSTVQTGKLVVNK
jgi:hypothetical protein